MKLRTKITLVLTLLLIGFTYGQDDTWNEGELFLKNGESKKGLIKVGFHNKALTISRNDQTVLFKSNKKAKKEKKPVLIYFTGSDWCGPCKILDDKLFHTKKFKSLSDKNLILLEVDIPRRRDLIAPKKMKENLYLQKKYRVKAFPTLMMVNHRGKKLGAKKGFIMTEYYYPFFQSVLRKY